VPAGSSGNGGNGGTAGSTVCLSQPPLPLPAPRYFALKMLKKSEIVRLKQVEHIKAEKAILSRVAHPFIISLYSTFQDEHCLYMSMEYVIGGELFSQLRKCGRFSNDTARFYAAEIVLALQYLHSKNVSVHRPRALCSPARVPPCFDA
jgi:serine/threonine protein kinase